MLKLLKFLIENILYFVMYKIVMLSKTKSHSDVINYFKELPVYNKTIKKPLKVQKTLIDQLDFLFYEELSMIKTDQVFKGYAV